MLEYPAGARFPELTEPAYSLMTYSGPFQFPRIYLLNNRYPWRFEGRCHEVAVCEGVGAQALLGGIVYRRIGGGARDDDPRRKYLNDAALLEEDLRADPTDGHRVLMLGQSYEDAGELPRALSNYERRVLLGGWDEAVFTAAFNAARVREKLGLPREQVTRAYLAAWEMRPHRAEPLYMVARLARAARRLGGGAGVRGPSRRAGASGGGGAVRSSRDLRMARARRVRRRVAASRGRAGGDRDERADSRGARAAGRGAEAGGGELGDVSGGGETADVWRPRGRGHLVTSRYSLTVSAATAPPRPRAARAARGSSYESPEHARVTCLRGW